MVITVMAKGDGKQGGVWLVSSRPEFRAKYGEKIDTSYTRLFRTMEAVAEWANNDVNEACMFDVI